MASVKLNEIPTKVYEALIDKQSDIKKLKGIGQFSMERTIYAALEEWLNCQPKKPAK